MIRYGFLLFAVTLFQDILCLSKIEVRIPQYIQTGETADLICSYYLDSHSLYSVKWYKGRHEFYRYMPDDHPPVKVFPIKGMKINMTASDHVRVVLEDVETKLSGVYLCEVTITPTFYAMAESANMTVIDFPASGPEISSARQQYQVGEIAHLTCTVRRSSPPSELFWFINDEPVHEMFVSGENRGGTSEDQQVLELSFSMTASHFINNKVKLKCLATIAGLYWRTAEITLSQEHPQLKELLHEGGTDKSGSISGGGNLSSSLLTFLLIVALAQIAVQQIQNKRF